MSDLSVLCVLSRRNAGFRGAETATFREQIRSDPCCQAGWPDWGDLA
jgi:hypothetical protein